MNKLTAFLKALDVLAWFEQVYKDIKDWLKLQQDKKLWELEREQEEKAIHESRVKDGDDAANSVDVDRLLDNGNNRAYKQDVDNS